MRLSLLFLIAIIFLGVSCTKEHDIIDIEEEVFTPVSNLEVETLIISIGEDIPFMATIDGEEYSSLGGEVLVLKNILLDKKGSCVVIQSAGYFDEIRYVIPTLGANLHIEVSLSKIKTDSGFCKELDGFNSKEGGTISGFKIEIEIKPNSIVDESGNIFEGEVRVFACNIFNSAYVSNIRKMPQNFFVEDEVSKSQNIGGGIHIVLLDNLDNRIYSKKGETFKIKFELQSSEQIGVPDIVDCIYFDVENSTWNTIGKMEKEGEIWNGTVSELGLITWGVTYESRVAQIRLLTDLGEPVPNKMVFLSIDFEPSFGFAFSDNRGIVKINVPLGVDFKMRAFDKNFAGIFINQEYGIVGKGQEEIIKLDDFILESEAFQVFQGNVIDCDETVLLNSAVVLFVGPNDFSYGDYKHYLFPNEEGEFNFVQSKTSDNPIKMKAVNFESGKISDLFNVFNYQEKIVDFENLQVCD